MDGNLHAGPQLVKLFMDFLERNSSLVVVNSVDKFKGVITRRRELESRMEEVFLRFIPNK